MFDKITIIGCGLIGSSLLRIIAGIDQEYQGEVVFSPGYSVGLLEQEPQLDPDKTVKEVISEAVSEITDLLKQYDEINLKFSEPEILEDPDKMNKLIEKQGEVQEKLYQVGAWDLDNKLHQ